MKSSPGRLGPLLLLPVLAPSTALAAGNFLPAETTLLDRGLSLLGLVAFTAMAWALSTDRGAVKWRPVVWGLGLQLAFGLLVLSPLVPAVINGVAGVFTGGREVVDNDLVRGFFFTVVDGGVRQLLTFAEAGANFVFQSVEPHQILNPSGTPEFFVGRISPPVKTFAFWILPTIVFFSSLMSVLYHLGIMQVFVNAIAWAMQRTMGTSGAESLSAAANIFVGQTEAPIVIKPFIGDMTRSELNSVMTAGFATVAGGVMAAYVGFLQDIPGIAGHLVVASILSAPAALAIAKLMVPETGQPVTSGPLRAPLERTSGNAIEAAARGASDGMTLAINVAAMLIAFVGLVALVDWSLGALPVRFCDGSAALGYAADCAPLTLTQALGWLFAPIAFLMGVPWGEAVVVGRLLGEKIVLTEFLAYISLGGLVNGEVAVISERSAIIASYALCGFANFASIGIQIGGIGGIAPHRIGDLASLGLRAMVGGSLAAFMTATVAGVLMG